MSYNPNLGKKGLYEHLKKIEGTLLQFYEYQLEQWVKPQTEMLFVCRGCIDRIENNRVYCTVYRNELCEDPQLVQFEQDDFPEVALGEGSWFIYKQYRKKNDQMVEFSSVIEVLPEEPYSEDEALAEYESLMKQLPDEF